MATWNLKNSEGRIRQLNLNDTAGEIVESFNIDLKTNPGKLKLAYPLKKVADSTLLNNQPITGFGVLSANQGTVYAITSSTSPTASRILESQTPFTTWTNVTDGNPLVLEDCTVFDSQLVVAESTNLSAFDGFDLTEDWWTARGNPALTNSQSTPNVAPHVLETLYIGTETLVVTDGNKVHAYVGGIDSGAITNVTVDLGGDFIATCIKSSIRRAWIGTMTKDSGEARVFEWDGASTNYTQSFPVGTKGVLAMEIVNDIPLIVTDTGEIKMFNNVGFQTVAQFPFAFYPHVIDGIVFGQVQGTALLRPIHPKGIRKNGNTVYMMVNWQSDGLPVDENTPAGLWALDLTTFSLTHLTSPESNHVFQQSSPIMVIEDGATRIFTGGKLSTDSDEEGIWIEDLSPDTTHYGNFTTIEVESNSVKDVFEKVIIKALLGSDDEIVVKYRVSNDTNLPITAEDVAWLTPSQFNTTEDLSIIKARFDEGHQDEITVLLGSGAGRLAHITNIEESSSTYSVAVDEEIGTEGETTTVRIDNWKKIPTSMVKSDGEVIRFGMGDVGTFCQVKVSLKGKGNMPEIRDMLIKSNSKEQL
jgi:hypothetical protein